MHKYKGTIHVVFQGIYSCIIVVLGFFFKESLELIRIPIEIPYHMGSFSLRIFFRCGV